MAVPTLVLSDSRTRTTAGYMVLRTPIVPILALALAFPIFLGCVKIDGGAVEVSWVVRSSDGRAITDCSCSDPAIAAVRLKLVGVGGDIDGTTPCDGRAQCQFPCQRQTGATPFDIRETQPGEMYEISVIAVGADGADLPQVTTPAPILRTVTRGQPTELEAFLLETVCAKECEGMNRSGVCTRP
jgi:hypothetical protein